MAGQAFARALVASGGSIIALGGATLILSTFTVGAITTVTKQRMKHLAQPCSVCNGNKHIRCDVCMGRRVIAFNPVKAPVPAYGQSRSQCVCPMCTSTGKQVCPNCLGQGITYPTGRKRRGKSGSEATTPAATA